MPAASLSRQQAYQTWLDHNPPDEHTADHTSVFLDKVLLRQDTVLVYQDSSNGHVKMASWGSEVALLPRSSYPTHPEVLPDTPGVNNYRYHLIGVVDATSDA